MPGRPPRPCVHPGCRALVYGSGSRCPHHQQPIDEQRKRQHRDYNARRPESDRFYGSAEWRALRDSFIAANPRCQLCAGRGIVRQSRIADHIIPRKERPDLSLDRNNLRALCWPCHNAHGRRVRG